MIFDSENKRKRGIKMNSFSQSFGGVYDECPAKAWYKLRNKNIKISLKSGLAFFVYSLYNEGKVHETTHHFMVMFLECCVYF